MFYHPFIHLIHVQSVYSGPEGELWELIMGEQIHIGGWSSSLDLLNKACIPPRSTGIDLCCCTGAGMRFLLRYGSANRMIGVDATQKMIDLGKLRCCRQNVSDRVEFVHADVCDSGLPDRTADFIWGEDAWCYVADKPRLIAEAARLAKPGGIIAFTDWVEGDQPLTEQEAHRFMKFMKFPSFAGLTDYTHLLRSYGCDIVHAENTHRFMPYIDLYIEMLTGQLTYDALRIIQFDLQAWSILQQEMAFMQDLAKQQKIMQGLFVAKKREH